MDASNEGNIEYNHDPTKPSVSDVGIQLDLPEEVNECKIDTGRELLPGSPQTDLAMTISSTLSECTTTSVPQEIVMISGRGDLVKLESQDSSLSSIGNVNSVEPLTKRICMEQDGQTYILALQDGAEGLQTGIVEVQRRITQSELLNGQEESLPLVEHDVNQAWFTSKEDKTTLHNKGHIWKQGMWSKDEVELLERNIHQYCEEHAISDPATIIFEMTKDERKDFYRTIAKGLNRPLFSVYRRVIRMYDNKNHVGKYTPEELERLKKLRSVYGNDWQAIGGAMGRSASSIKDRCRLMKDNCNQGKWLPSEERTLAEAVYDFASALPGEMISSGLSWASVAARVGTRSEKQCRTKWLNYLNWKEAGGTEWTRDDDIALIYRVYSANVSDENMMDWSTLAKDWSSVRSPQWLRGKWWSLKRHVPNVTMTFSETCEYLYRHHVQRIRMKEEAAAVSIDTQTDTLSAQQCRRHKPTILRATSLSPSPTGIVVTPSTDLSNSVTTLATTAVTTATMTTNEICTSALSSAMTPVLQTLEVLPQGLHLATNPQTFLLAHSAQSAIPLTLSPSQIIIQAVAADSLQRNENVTVQINAPPQIIISATNPVALNSLTTAQIPSNTRDIGTVHESLIDNEEHFETQTINDSEAIGEVTEIDESDEVIEDDHLNNVKQTHLIMSDPMLAASTSPENTSDAESEKAHTEHCLDAVNSHVG